MQQKETKPQKNFETIKNTIYQIDKNQNVNKYNEVHNQSELDNKATGKENTSGESGGQDYPNKNNTSQVGNNTGTSSEEVDYKTPLETPDVSPSFPGGMEALQNFLRKHLRTPDELEAGQRASVKVKFIVGYEGEIYGYEVVQTGGDAFDAEVIRVLKKMPKWIPGIYKGQNVSVYYVIPVKFEAIEE
ncbi:MAG: energy transducer TonB [Sphingobacteriales bacterium]